MKGSDMILVERLYLEETEDCERHPLPFKFKYFFTKDPCKKCLVRAACNLNCELKYEYWDQLHSVNMWKKKWRTWFQNPSKLLSIYVIIGCLLFICVVTFSCREVNQERAKKYYDQNVKNFPEENEDP